MIVTLFVVAYNEQDSLPDLLNDILNQTYPKDKTEIILIDNGSTDKTGAIMREFEKIKGFYNISVIKMAKENLATACNVAFENFKGDIIVRVDAHSSIVPDFIEKNVECIKSGEDVCGGYRPCVVKNKDNYHKTLLLAEESMFGSSFAKYRRKNENKCYLDSLFHICLKREVIKKVGGYNEILGRTEDNEYNYRLRKNGYKLCFDPEINSTEYIRSDFRKMIKQKYSNGYWIGLTLGVCKECISIFHFAPLVLVTSILMCIVLACLGLPFFIATLTFLYLICIIGISLVTVINSENKNIFLILLPFIFIALHMCYGVGTLVGIIKMPFFIKNIKKDYKERIEAIKDKV